MATGGEPKKLPSQVDDKNVTTFRSIKDFQKLEKIAKDGAHIVVVGGGFLGSELAVALAHKCKFVVYIINAYFIYALFF